MNESKTSNQYEVLSPWAEADPIPLKGLSPRLNDLSGKRIGLYYNFKRAGRPILTVVEAKLKERFPSCETIWHANPLPPGKGVTDLEGEDKAKFEEWVKGVDAVVAAVGD